MRAAAYGLLAALAVASCVGVGFAAAWKTKPAPKTAATPQAAPPFQQVTYSAAGLLQTLSYQGLPVADITFANVRQTRRGYRVVWLVTESDGTVGRWVVTTDRHGTVKGISLKGRRRTPKA